MIEKKRDWNGICNSHSIAHGFNNNLIIICPLRVSTILFINTNTH